MHYRKLVEDVNQIPVIVRTDLDHTEAQDTWWQMTESECETFALDPRLARALELAWVRFESMTGGIDDEKLRFIRANVLETVVCCTTTDVGAL